MGYHVLQDHKNFLVIAILVSESHIFQRLYIYRISKYYIDCIIRIRKYYIDGITLCRVYYIMYESMYKILLLDQRLPRPIRLVLSVIGWLFGWLVTQFSQKRL